MLPSDQENSSEYRIDIPFLLLQRPCSLIHIVYPQDERDVFKHSPQIRVIGIKKKTTLWLEGCCWETQFEDELPYRAVFHPTAPKSVVVACSVFKSRKVIC